MKRYVDKLVTLYTELLKDAAYVYPALRAELDRDLARLTHLAICRGLPFFMVDLPQLGKHLDRCVSEGLYKPSGLPASQPVGHGVGIPKLFRGLYYRIFNKDGGLKDDADSQAYFFLRQLLFCCKKADFDCSDEAKDREIQKFLVTDSELPQPSPAWQVSPHGELEKSLFASFAANEGIRTRVCGKFGETRGSSLIHHLDTLCRVMCQTLGPFKPEDWRFRHGPGNVSDLGSGENRYQFHNWSDRLEAVFPYADIAHHDYAAWVDKIRIETLRAFICGDVENSRLSSKEPVSKLVAVPKTLTKPRLIAAEPSEMMFCQQSIRDYFYTRCERTWINDFVDFRDQSRNQELAMCGSVDGSLATIDLSEASDRVSCDVVGAVFGHRMSVLRALIATRSRFCDVAGCIVELRKYSTMGNATTFPVESLVFLMAALACGLEGQTDVSLETIQTLRGSVSVFGDDIIVPQKIARSVVDLLEALGFKVNVNKSYLDGQFRESCGVDAFRGDNVTPVYWHGFCDGSPESVDSCVTTSNNFYSKFLVHSARFLQSDVEEAQRGIPTVLKGSGVFGFNSFVRPFCRTKKRWNWDLQREEAHLLQLRSRNETVPITDNTSLLQFFTEDPDPAEAWKGGVRARSLLRYEKRWVPTAQFSRTECS